MVSADLHTHTAFCDGRDTPEEMVISAIAKGLKTIGICVHSYMTFDESYCVPKDRYPEFQQEILLLREKYREQINVLCGVEQDFYSSEPTSGFDYVIGSVHYVEAEGRYFPVDWKKDELEKVCRKYFNSDWYSLAESYYSAVSHVAEKTGCDIIGHFDLITKFNESGMLFDELHPRYVSASRAAADALLRSGKPFEINTGAISRGYRTEPYPSDELIRYIRKQGGKFILSSDAHAGENISFEFDKWEHLL